MYQKNSIIYKGFYLLLVFPLLLLLTNCENDENIQKEPFSNEKTGYPDIKKVSLFEIQQDPKLSSDMAEIEKLFTYKKEGQTKKVINKISSISILTDEILQVKTPFSKAYTFRTSFPIQPDADYENFVIYTKEGGSQMVLLL